METQIGRLIDALDRVETFLQENGGRLSEAITSEAHGKFSASRARMREQAEVQDSEGRKARSSVATKHALRRKLVRKHMQPISVIAQAELPQAAELTALTIPARNTQFRTVVTAAYGMAKAARAYEAVFIAGGCKPGFIERLVEAAAALERSIDTRGQKTALRIQATAAIQKEARIARAQLRVLNVLVRAEFEDDDAMFDRWNSLRRVAAVAASPRALTDEEPGSGPVREIPRASRQESVTTTEEVTQPA